MEEIAIRPAVQGDCAALVRLIAQLEYEVSAEEVAERLAAMEPEEQLVLVAELDGRAVGCLSTSIMRVLHRPKPVGRISMMVVEEGLRGHGIGAMLVRAAEAALAEAGCGLVEVTSHVRRTEAHSFYEHLGYERTSHRFSIDTGARE
jgi:predicted N-acetyltransferase YhbS